MSVPALPLTMWLAHHYIIIIDVVNIIITERSDAYAKHAKFSMNITVFDAI